jgi:hypothetical protein
MKRLSKEVTQRGLSGVARCSFPWPSLGASAEKRALLMGPARCTQVYLKMKNEPLGIEQDVNLHRTPRA